MNPETNNARYTAYALNELDAAERAHVEQELAAHPELRREVEEIRALSDTLTRVLASEPGVKLDEAGRAAIRDAARHPAPRARFRFSRSLPWLGAAAALLVTAIGLRFYETPRARTERETVAPPPAMIENEARVEGAAAPEAPKPEALNGPLTGEMSAAAPGVPQERDVTVTAAEDGGLMVPLQVTVPPPVFVGTPAPATSAPPASTGRAYRAARVVAKQAADSSSREALMYEWSDDDESNGAPVLSPSLDDFPERRDQSFIRVEDHPLSTFSVDVDTASYSVVRKFLSEGSLPPADAVRVEELINYFPYDYAPPKDATPFAAHLEVAPSPWNPERSLVRIALKGRELSAASRPPLNLVYLVDVSGSMEPANKLPLVKRALQMLAKQLDERDRIALVVYAGSSGLVLPPTSGARTQEILDALERLGAGGSTAGGEGIQLAYKVAREHFNAEAVNRVILCTDGDFNVGLTQRGDLERLIEDEAKSRVFLTVLGFGMGNYKDSTLELLSNKGNGNYGYIDDFSEARKVLVDQMLGTMVTIAKDVKVQVEFNPARVAGYRLIGYENRLLAKEDFNNDMIDAGDIGAGHTVTAFYELIPAGQPVNDAPAVDPLKYRAASDAPARAAVENAELLTVKLRYKQPDGDTSSKLEFPLAASALDRRGKASRDFRFAAAVAALGQRLRGSEHIGEFGYDQILALAEPAVGEDPFGYRAEFVKLVRNAKAVSGAR